MSINNQIIFLMFLKNLISNSLFFTKHRRFSLSDERHVHLISKIVLFNIHYINNNKKRKFNIKNINTII